MIYLFLLIGLSMIVFSFFLSLSRLLNCLMVVEKFKVLILFVCLMLQKGETFIFFMALMVIFTIEVVLGLVVLTRLWDLSGLIDMVGW